MQVNKARVGQDGEIVIPSSIRKAMGLKGGEELMLWLDEEGLHLQTMGQALRRSQVIVRKYVSADRSLADELIAARRVDFRGE